MDYVEYCLKDSVVAEQIVLLHLINAGNLTVLKTLEPVCNFSTTFRSEFLFSGHPYGGGTHVVQLFVNSTKLLQEKIQHWQAQEKCGRLKLVYECQTTPQTLEELVGDLSYKLSE